MHLVLPLPKQLNDNVNWFAKLFAIIFSKSVKLSAITCVCPTLLNLFPVWLYKFQHSIQYFRLFIDMLPLSARIRCFEFMKHAREYLMNKYNAIELYLLNDAKRVTRALGARRISEEWKQKYLVFEHSAINDPNRVLMLIKITNRQIYMQHIHNIMVHNKRRKWPFWSGKWQQHQRLW